MAREDDYQTSALGDLSDGLARERGDFVISQGRLMRQLPSEQQDAQKVNAPKIPSGVVPTYNTLPANGGRFAFGQLSDITGLGAGSQTAVIFSQVVPAGRVLLAKEFRVNVEDVLNSGSSLGIPTNTFSVSIYVNNNAELFAQNIQVEALDDYYPTSAIAGPGDEVTIKVNFNFSSVTPRPDEVKFIANLRGDILITNEMPTQYTALRQSPIPVMDQGK